MTATTITDAPTSDIALIGRLAIDEGVVSTVTAVRDANVFTARAPSQERPATAIIALPLLGESVRISAFTTGFWIGLVDEPTEIAPDWHLRAYVLVGAEIRTVRVEQQKIDARHSVQGTASQPEIVAMTALLRSIRNHEQTRREHQEKLDSLVRAAHQEADDRDWCDEFDDIIERHGLPRRVREFPLRLEVTAVVYLTASGPTYEDALESISDRQVWDAMEEDDIVWTAELDD